MRELIKTIEKLADEYFIYQEYKYENSRWKGTAIFEGAIIAECTDPELDNCIRTTLVELVGMTAKSKSGKRGSER